MRRLLLFLLPLTFVTGCAWWAAPPEDPLAALCDAEGNVVWEQAFKFARPPLDWKLVQLDEDDYSVAFIKEEAGPFPSQSLFAYAEEPFGYSRDLRERSRQFFKRVLWASRVTFGEVTTRPVKALGGEALEATTEGRDRVRGHKVWCKVVFALRGERVVAFYFTQWRPLEADFDPAPAADFGGFIGSFQYLRPSFYETL